MFNDFDKKFEGMQAQINKNMEPPAKKYEKNRRTQYERER